MKLGVLFSGGKDSCAATYLAQEEHAVVCLMTMVSENKASYMFHTPNINKAQLQADAMGIPLVTQETKGAKEKELDDLKKLIQKAQKEHNIEGVVTGAIDSIYQATRIQKICHELNLQCFNPLWQREPQQHMEWLLEHGFEIYISGIAAYPLTEEWLGKKITEKTLQELTQHNINLAGEGGEFETFVTHGPKWKKRIVVEETTQEYNNHAGTWHILKAELRDAVLLETKEKKQKKQQTNILVISTCAEKLHEKEFVNPIKDAICPCTVKHYKKINEKDIENASRIIIAGTALLDNEFQENLKYFSWLKKTTKPVLGICAGFQIISLVYKGKLIPFQAIGLERLDFVCSFAKIKEAYFLHQNSATIPKGFTGVEHKRPFFFEKDNLVGVLFHPEVRNKEFLQGFIEEN